MTDRIAPGAAIGVLGGGQLGRMFAIAARRLGYRVHVLAPEGDTPTGQVADVEIQAAYEDLAAVEAFARAVEVVTFEFENVPAATAATAARFAPVRPAGGVLHVAQNRLREKRFLAGGGIPVAPFAAVEDAAGLDAALASIGLPAVLKRADWGYDGKGQAMLRPGKDAHAAWRSLSGADGAGAAACVLEGFIDFARELSVVIARGLGGKALVYGPFANAHRDHILDVTVWPAPVAPAVAARAHELARAIATSLDLVGVLCVELFETRAGELLVNELAPRPHNSGHLTIDAFASCQFEQQVRAVCGLPLGSADPLVPAAAMANLLGDLWAAGPPRFERALADPRVKLHLYGKREARPGRKMGHVTVLAAEPGDAERRARAARDALV